MSLLSQYFVELLTGLKLSLGGLTLWEILAKKEGGKTPAPPGTSV